MWCNCKISGTIIHVSYVGNCWLFYLHCYGGGDVSAVAVAIVLWLLVKYSELARCCCVLCFSVGTRLVEQDFSFVLLLEQNLWTKMFLLYCLTKLLVHNLDLLICLCWCYYYCWDICIKE